MQEIQRESDLDKISDKLSKISMTDIRETLPKIVVETKKEERRDQRRYDRDDNIFGPDRDLNSFPRDTLAR